MYQVKHKSSGIVAFSSNDRAQCKYWIECNGYEPDTPEIDQETGEPTGQWIKGACLGLYEIKRVKNA